MTTNKQSNLIVVSNRLPITVEGRDDQDPDRKWKFRQSSGGLVTALRGMGSIPFKWVGWTGLSVPEGDQGSLRDQLLQDLDQFPVFLSENDASLYYDGFSNGILWPLFHYLFEKNSAFDEQQWRAYQRVNQQFADAVLSIYKPGDMVWVHDYHLMLLPAMLRRVHKDMKISFFLHIPFPSSEIYRILPVRRELLEGVLACNLIGFHTYGFARHFLSTCTRILGCDTSPNGLVYRGIKVHVVAAPIGINPKQFSDIALSEVCRARINDFTERQYKGKNIILGIDRLDYTKGVVLKLQAFESFLTRYPEFADNTVLIQVGVPTREDVGAYRALISEVNELVGAINSQFGTLDGFPVHYINKSVSGTDLCALYAIADALLVTSIRDGMNLVCQEYVVVQEERVNGNKIVSDKEEAGVLILSEFTGSARSLGGSLIINPWDLDGVADAIHDALVMSPKLRNARHKQNMSIMRRNTAEIWGRNFLTMFENACHDMDPRNLGLQLVRDVPQLDLDDLRSRYQQAKTRLFLFDYDGTLVPIKKYPSLTIPDERCLQVLEQLSKDPRNLVYIISGRPRNILFKFLGTLPNVGLAAEHGFYTKHPGQDEWDSLYNVEETDLSWLEEIVPFVEHIESRTPGSLFERKDSSLVFHYRNADLEFGRWQANELKIHLESSFASRPMEIITGKMLVEIRPIGVSKGAAAAKLITEKRPDFIFSAGDDSTDEEMFQAISEATNLSNSPQSSPVSFDDESSSSSSSSSNNNAQSPPGQRSRFFKGNSPCDNLQECYGISVLIGDPSATVTATHAQGTLPTAAALLDCLQSL